MSSCSGELNDPTTGQLTAGAYRYDEVTGFWVGDLKVPISHRAARLLATVMRGGGAVVSFDAIARAVELKPGREATTYKTEFYNAKRAFEKIGATFPIEVVRSKGRYWCGPPVSFHHHVPRLGLSVRLYPAGAALSERVTNFYVVDARESISNTDSAPWGEVMLSPEGWTFERKRAGDRSIIWGPAGKASLMAATTGRTIGFGLTFAGWHMLTDSGRMKHCLLMTHLEDKVRQLTVSQRISEEDIIEIIREELIDNLKLHSTEVEDALAIDKALDQYPKTVMDLSTISNTPYSRITNIFRLSGIPQQRMIRLRRFQRVISHLKTVGPRRRLDAIKPEYYDEIHFRRDFMDFMSITVKQFFHLLPIFPEIIGLREMIYGAALIVQNSSPK